MMFGFVRESDEVEVTTVTESKLNNGSASKLKFNKLRVSQNLRPTKLTQTVTPL